MPFEDRLRTCEFISVSGQEFILQFDELTREGGKKSSVHEIPDTNNAETQDQGNKVIRFPMNLYLSGENYDIVADEFFEALHEKSSPGNLAELRHPRWGNFNVLLMTATQTEKFVSGMARAVFDVVFVRVADLEYPLSVGEISDEIKAKKLTLDDILSEVYAAGQRLRTLAEKNAITSTLNAINETAGDVLGAIAEVEESINDSFNTILDSINSNLDTLLGAPALLAGSYTNLYNQVIAVPGNLRDKINGYTTMFENIFAESTPQPNNEARNTVNLQQLLGVAAVGSLMESVLFQDFETRDEVLFVISAIENLNERLIFNLDNAETFFQDQKIGDGFTSAQDVLRFSTSIKELSINYLLQQSFQLTVKKTFYTNKEYTPMELCFEVYGTIERLDFFIETNDLIEDEYFNIPIGREVVVYE